MLRMRPNLLRLHEFLFALALLISTLTYGQVYDFDSLAVHNSQFAKLVKSISDTLDIFDNPTPLDIVLRADFKALVKNKLKEEYQPAYFQMMFNDTVELSRNIKIKPRGNFRKRHCFMPPLKLNFSKKEAFSRQFEEFDKMKMVLDCKRNKGYEQYLLSEYYAYKIQNIITEYSLRVRLMKVSYRDSSGRYKDATRFAFIIESMDEMNQRLQTIELERKGIRDVKTDRKVLAEAYLFQYLIGNTDWSIPMLHNIHILKSTDPTKPNPYVVPYDFDYAGIVNTSYAVPNKELGTESVRERVYRGVCPINKQLEAARQAILGKKQEIIDLYEQDLYLSKRNKTQSISYIKEFFEILENDNAFDWKILSKCRK
jgi:hypothetical protein